jgi:ABC-type sugar transport system ATPase subunit
MAFLEIKGLRKRYGALEVLKGIDLTLDKGGFLVLIGPSGCGKSTLLGTIAGLESISAGEICIEGQRINDLHPSKRDIAMVFQSYALYPNMTVAENMAFGMEMRGVAKPEREKAVAEVAKTLQLEHLLKRRPSQLSGGQRQRVAMGRALVREPRVFLFDEPLSNLDAKLRVDMRVEIKRLHQRTGATIVYVTHDQIEAMTLATRIAVLKDGELQQVGTPHEVYNRPANLFVADFMGSPSMNLLEEGSPDRTVPPRSSSSAQGPCRSRFLLPRARTWKSSAMAQRSSSAFVPKLSATSKVRTGNRRASRPSRAWSRLLSQPARTHSLSPRSPARRSPRECGRIPTFVSGRATCLL